MNKTYPGGTAGPIQHIRVKARRICLGLDPKDTESRRIDHSWIRESLSVWGHFHDHNTEFTP